MALNPEYVGRVFGPGEPYEVSRVKIAEFADAIGEPSELCRDKDSAVKAGYPDVIAPPTFAIVEGLRLRGDAGARARARAVPLTLFIACSASG